MTGPTEAAVVATATAPGRRGRAVLLTLFVAAVVVQLVVLYTPDAGGSAPFRQADKVVHVLVFLVPVALALLAGLPRWLVVMVFGAQAVLSEVVQGVFLAHRSGDPRDAVADLTGVALGVLVANLIRRRPD